MTNRVNYNSLEFNQTPPINMTLIETLDYPKSKQHSSQVMRIIKSSCKYIKYSIQCMKSSI
ncbi:unnamed protein product, partial [Musa textilis]